MSKDKRSRYSNVYRRMWNDARFMALSAAPPNGQTLFQRLLTGPELTNIPGVFTAGEAGPAEALGWPLEDFRQVFAEVLEQGLVKVDWKARFVFVPKAIRHDPPESPNVVRSWKMPWDELPECQLKLEAYQALKDYVKGIGKGFAQAFDEACPRPSANQEQEQEQDQDPPKPPGDRPPDRPPEPTIVGSPRRLFDLGSAAEDAAVRAYGEAVSSVTSESFVFPSTKSDRALVCKILNGHSKAATITDAIAWLRVTLVQWVSGRDVQYTPGWEPRFFNAWINGGRPPPKDRSPHSVIAPASPRIDLMGYEP